MLISRALWLRGAGAPALVSQQIRIPVKTAALVLNKFRLTASRVDCSAGRE
jgi:hypothetical protein